MPFMLRMERRVSIAISGADRVAKKRLLSKKNYGKGQRRSIFFSLSDYVFFLVVINVFKYTTAIWAPSVITYTAATRNYKMWLRNQATCYLN